MAAKTTRGPTWCREAHGRDANNVGVSDMVEKTHKVGADARKGRKR